MTKVTVIDKREVPSADPSRIGKLDAYITYQVDPLHAYLITLPDEKLGGPDEDQVIAEAIRQDLAKRERFTGKTLEV